MIELGKYLGFKRIVKTAQMPLSQYFLNPFFRLQRYHEAYEERNICVLGLVYDL